MAEFYFPPEWENVPPPELSEVDPDRIEGLQNGFLAATQAALHTNPDAFYRTTGQDAVEGVPALQEQLSQLRDAALAQAKDEGERAALAPRLDANLIYVQGGIDRHVAEQKQVRNRQIIAERQALNQRAAELDHHDDKSLVGFAEAHASAAQALARLTGADEEPAMLAARSGIWRSAIGQRLATGQGVRALALFDVMKDRLTPADQRALDVPLQAARTDLAADQWIEREAATQGEPLAKRLQADTSLSPVEKATVLAKVEAKNSAQESARIATVKGLDDRLGVTTGMLATQPATYRPGTLAAIANAYDDADEPDKVDTTWRMALQESFLLPFARSSVAAQQRLIDGLPEGEDRSAAEAIQRQQAEAFAKDVFTAGTALYPEVGPAVPIEDVQGRIAQARTIAAYRGIPVAPFTADEITALRRQLTNGTPQQRDAVLVQLNALPEDMKAAIVPDNAATSFGIDVEASMKAMRELNGEGTDANATTAGRQGGVHTTEPAPDSSEYRTANAEAPRPEANQAVPAAAVAAAGAVEGAGAGETFALWLSRILERAAADAARLAPRAAGAAAAPVTAAATILLTPTNTQSSTLDIGDGLRVRTAPGQRSATVERRVDGGLLGTGIGAQWEDLPVDAGWATGADGRRVIAIDRGQLERAIGAVATDNALRTAGIAMAKPPSDDKSKDEQPPPGIGHNSGEIPNPKDPKSPFNPAPLVAPAVTGDARRESEDEEIKRTWGDPSTLEGHFVDHGADFGASSEIDYARKAHEFLQRARREGLPMKVDAKGVIRVYDAVNNVFGSYGANDTTKTFYAPNPAIHGKPTNMDYWNSQPGFLVRRP